MKALHYLATFAEEPEGGFTVTFADLPGCISYGETWEAAVEMAEDALAHWLADEKDVPKPSTFAQIREGLEPGQHPVPVPVNPKLVAGYSKTVRVNISLPSTTLEQIDEKAKAQGLKRSEFLAKAALEYEVGA